MADSFKKATVRQEAKEGLLTDFIRALVASDIAFEKTDNPVMRQFLKKHVIKVVQFQEQTDCVII